MCIELRVLNEEENRMRPIDFVIAALPRSGTRYTHRVFTCLDILTGHERYFTDYKQVYALNDENVFGEVSWMCVPFLNKLPSSTIILYQKRDPIKILDSMWGPRGMPSMLNLETPYGRFINRYCPEAFKDRPEFKRLLEFYKSWSATIEKYALFSYNITDLDDPEFCCDLVKTVTKQDIPLETMKEALRRVSPTDHTVGKNDEWAREFLDLNYPYRKYIK